MASGNVNIFLEALHQLPGAIQVSYEKMAIGAKFLIQERIQETGAAADGQQLQVKKPYSASYLAYKKGEGPNPFAAAPETLPSNRYRGFVDFTLTGSMWNNIGQVLSEITEQSIKVSIGAKSPDTQAKLDNIANLWGDPFEMNQEEIALSQQVLDDEMQFQLDIIFR